jgi:hypothetical protein
VVTDGGHVSFEMGVNILLTSCTSGSCNKGAQRLNAPTHEVASCEKCKEEVNYCLLLRLDISEKKRMRARHFNLRGCE